MTFYVKNPRILPFSAKHSNNLYLNVDTIEVLTKEPVNFPEDANCTNLRKFVGKLNTSFFSEYTCKNHLQNIEEIYLGQNFNPESFELNNSPKLRILHFGGSFNDDCNFLVNTSPESLPSLTELKLGGEFVKEINPTSTPFICYNDTLRVLILTYKYNSPIDIRGTSITDISFGYTFDQPIENIRLSPKTETISFGNNFNQSLPSSLNETYPSLKRINVKGNFNQIIGCRLEVLDVTSLNQETNIQNLCIEFSNENQYIDTLIIKEKQFFIYSLFVQVYHNTQDLLSKYVKNLMVINTKKEIVLQNTLKNIEESIISYSVIEPGKYSINDEMYGKCVNIMEKIMSDTQLSTLISCNNDNKYNVPIEEMMFEDDEDNYKRFIHTTYNGEYSEAYNVLKLKMERMYNKLDYYSLFFYVGSRYYKLINSILRTGEMMEITPNPVIKNEFENPFFVDRNIIEQVITNIQSLFWNPARIPVLDRPLICRRGVSYLAELPDESEFPVNITEKGMLSCSLHLHPSRMYNQWKNDEASELTRPRLFIMLVPEGIPSFACENYFNNKIEKEILFPPGVVYTIVGKNENFVIENEEVYRKIFFNGMYKDISKDVKSLNDTFDIYYCIVRGVNCC